MVGARHRLGEIGRMGRDLFDPAEVRSGMDVGGGGDVESFRNVATFDYGVVPYNRAAADRAVEQHRVEADEDVVADDAWAVDDGAMSDGGVLADFHFPACFGMDHHAILDV